LISGDADQVAKARIFFVAAVLGNRGGWLWKVSIRGACLFEKVFVVVIDNATQ
jgi:hypothetical protein